MLITLLIGQFKQTQCINLQFDCIKFKRNWRFITTLQSFSRSNHTQEFDIPASWKLVAQMPFGDIREKAGEKEIQPTNNRLIVKNNLH